jgi:hypothetical protein
MPEPRSLPLHVLSRFDDHLIARARKAHLAAGVLSHDAVPRTLPRWRIVRHGSQQIANFVNPSSRDHRVRTSDIPSCQRGARIDQKIARTPTRLVGRRGLEIADLQPTEERNLHRPQQLGSSKMRSRRIEVPRPPSDLAGLHRS